MPVLPFLPLIIGGATKLIGGAIKPKSTSTTTANRDPEAQDVHMQLAEIIKNALSGGPSIPAWQKNQAAGQINAGYAQAAPRLESEYAKRGFESSGKMGGTLRGLEIGRINALSQSQNNLAQSAQQRYDEMLRLAKGYSDPTGHTTTSTGPSNFGGALSEVGGDLSTMLLLRNLFKNAGGGGGATSNWGSDTGDWGQEYG